MEHDGLKIILHAIESTINLPDKELCYSLRACVVGLLLNLIMGQTDLYPEVSILECVQSLFFMISSKIYKLSINEFRLFKNACDIS